MKTEFGKNVWENKEVAVELPKVPEQRLLQDAKDLFTPLFRKHGIPDENIERLFRCIEESALNRPTMVRFASGEMEGNKAKQGDRYRFLPEGNFIQAAIELNAEKPIMPDLTSVFDLKLRKGEGEELVSINEIDIFEALEKSAEPGSVRKLEPHEKLLVRLNRFLYEVHDGFHIYQSLFRGERLQRVIQAEPDLEVNDAQKNMVLHNLESNYWLTGDKEIEQSLFYNPFQQTGVLAMHTESYLDILSDELISKEILRHPETLVWVYNNMAMLVQAGRVIKDFFGHSGGRNVVDKKNAVVAGLEFLHRIFFAVGENGGQYREVLQKVMAESKTEFKNRKLVKVKDFDFVEVQNLMDFLKHGKDFRYYNSAVEPFEKEDLALLEKIYDRAIEHHVPPLDLDAFFTNIRIYYRTSDKSDKEKAQKGVEKGIGQLHLDVSVEDLKGLNGVDNDLYFSDVNARQYQRHYFLKKHILKSLGPKAEPQLKLESKLVFKEAEIEFNYSNVVALLGANIDPIEGLANVVGGLGLFGLQVGRLSPEERVIFMKMFEPLQEKYGLRVISQRTGQARKEIYDQIMKINPQLFRKYEAKLDEIVAPTDALTYQKLWEYYLALCRKYK